MSRAGSDGGSLFHERMRESWQHREVQRRASGAGDRWRSTRADPATRSGAISRVADQLGIHPETLRNWVPRAEIDGGERPGTTTSDAKRIAELEQEVGSCVEPTTS